MSICNYYFASLKSQQKMQGPPGHCHAVGCTSKYIVDGKIKFLKFPLHNEQLTKAWVRKIKRKDYIATETSRLCSEHFLVTDFVGGDKSCLKPTAVPSRFPNFPAPTLKKISQIIHKPMKIENIPSFIQDPLSSTTPIEDINSNDKGVQTEEGVTEINLKRRIKYLQQRIRRQTDTINILKDRVGILKTKQLLSYEAEHFILQHFKDVYP